MGVEIWKHPLAADGGVSLPEFVATLYRHGVHRLMVEGGQSILSAFLREQLVDWLIVTISPLLIGGLPALHDVRGKESFPYLASLQHSLVGPDLLVWGQPIWEP
jgi:3,4-dihydroxy 2-butanone 4-phosphate synthase/GTP cyclohydrolase II